MSDIPWASALSDPEGLRARGLFLVEGRRVLDRLLAGAAGGEAAIVGVLSTPAAAQALDLDTRVGDRLTTRSPDEMAALTGFNFHRGVLALVRRPPALVAATLIRDVIAEGSQRTGSSGSAAESGLHPVLVVAEHLVDVDNVGSCFRNARAFGVAGVLLDERCPDPLYRKSVRTSLGTVLDIPWAQAPMGEVLNGLATAGVPAVGLAPDRGGTTIADVAVELAGHGPVALVVGNEGHGLSGGTLDRCARVARIPMADGADSLNVATALAVALYEWRARRS